MFSPPVCGVDGSHGNNAGSPLHLVDGGPRVWQIGHVRHARQPVRAHNLAKLVAHLLCHLGVVQHVQDRPLDRRLQSLDTGREDVEEDLLQLGLRVHAVEGGIQLAVIGRIFDLEKVGVHQVPWHGRVQITLAVIDDELNKLEHLLPVAVELVDGVADPRKILHDGKVRR